MLLCSWISKFHDHWNSKTYFLLIVLNYLESILIAITRKLDLRSRKEDEKDIIDVITTTSISRFNLFDIVFLFRKKKKTDVDMFIFKNLKFLIKMFVMIVAPFFAVTDYRNLIFLSISLLTLFIVRQCKSQIDFAFTIDSEWISLECRWVYHHFCRFLFLLSKHYLTETSLLLLSILMFIVMITIVSEIIITTCGTHSVDMIYYIGTYIVDKVFIVLICLSIIDEWREGQTKSYLLHFCDFLHHSQPTCLIHFIANVCIDAGRLSESELSLSPFTWTDQNFCFLEQD